MFTSIQIKNFRLFDELEINGLTRFNLIGGMNGTGKSALLEAIFLLLAEGNPEKVVTLSAHRGIDRVPVGHNVMRETLCEPLFRGFDLRKTIEIAGTDRTDTRLAIRVTAEDAPATLLRDSKVEIAVALPVPVVLRLHYFVDGKAQHESTIRATANEVQFQTEPQRVWESKGYNIPARAQPSLSEDVALFGEFRRSKPKLDLVGHLAALQPRLIQLETIADASGIRIYADVGLDKLTPINYLGDGFNRYFRLLLRLAVARAGIVLIDEIENGIHYSQLGSMWETVMAVARELDVQVFATTHSWECIQAAHTAVGPCRHADLTYLRLGRRRDGSLVATAYDPELLSDALEHPWEVR